MISVALVGFGKMGQMIKENLSFIGAQVGVIIDKNIPEYPKSFADIALLEVQVAIEFTHPEAAFENVRELLRRKIPVVTGTTGWFDRIDELKAEFSEADHSLIYGANYSVGMNLLYDILRHSADAISKTDLYDVYGYEAHHRHKADAPSGTAKVLAETILDSFDTKTSVVYDIANHSLKKDEFCFSSIRAGEIVGKHLVGFDSDFDEITLSHNAKNRKGFAMGAILAAQYAISHKGFHDFKDIFSKVLEYSAKQKETQQ
ncbi:MAG: 4-hydroxy-tetrahydrodipicolinate reductase [Candidatus Cloacimonetes bacterium]|nr:4-hydroxy-tetrahydrodipicolinate reductase [Candidatus Cloacimonadota bacterium]